MKNTKLQKYYKRLCTINTTQQLTYPTVGS